MLLLGLVMGLVGLCGFFICTNVICFFFNVARVPCAHFYTLTKLALTVDLAYQFGQSFKAYADFDNNMA